MKTITAFCVGLLALFPLTVAAESGPSANGEFEFSLDGAAGAIQFDARTNAADTSGGQMSFDGAVEISNEDVDGTGDPVTPLPGLSMDVTFDCLEVDGNRAAMSGVVTAASDPGYLGQRAILAVQDNGQGANDPPDTFTWGVYRSTARTWIPSDAEVPDDTGASLVWIATDAERPDDVGVPSNRSTVVDCKSFPLGAYSLVTIPHGAGNVQVKP
jgi:hypothetical protein